MSTQRPVIIPKQYRIPRPTSVSQRRDPFWGSVAFELSALLLAVFVTIGSPFAAANRALYSIALRVASPSAAPATVAVVTLPSQALQSGNCAAALGRTLARDPPKASLLLPLAEALCKPASGSGAGPVRAFDLESLRLDAANRPLGVACPSGTRCLSDLGIAAAADWTAAADPGSVPQVSLDDLSTERVSSQLLRGRIVVVAIADGGEGRSARDVAATLAGALEGRVYRAASAWTSAFSAAFAGALIGLLQRRRGRLAALVAALLALLAGACAFALQLHFKTLFPLASFCFAVAASLVVSVLPRAVAARQAVRRASELIERAALIRTQTVHSISDADFWSRIASLAAQAHPHDEVLIAELPAQHWHLKFWSNGNIGEGAISERRRDVRRTPYVSEQGVPMIRVVRNYLVMKDVPVLVVPLMVLGEIEGYVFLCGVSAERAFAEQPDLAARLSKDLALLIRRRRLGSPDEAVWRRTAGALASRASERETALIEGARIALDDVTLFATLVREAPVGLLYADSFGDVRMLGKAFSHWLPKFGLKVPSSAGHGLLAVGSLPLSSLLARFADAAGVRAPDFASLAQTPDGVTLRALVPESGAHGPELKLSVRALFTHAESTPSIAGYVASLVENEPAAAPASSNVERLPGAHRHDALSVFSLAELVAEVTASASRRSGRRVRFEPPRTQAHVAGQRQVLARVLEDFLVDAASRLGADAGPVVRIQERHNTVTLSVLDLQLGLPSVALERALRAPTEAPDGLDALGQLVVAVEDSLGRVALKGEDGWGTTLTAALVRARPKLPIATSQKAAAVVVELSSWSGRAADRV